MSDVTASTDTDARSALGRRPPPAASARSLRPTAFHAAFGASLLLLLLAAAMRIFGAADMPIWSDEAWNIWATDSGVSTMLDRLAVNHHPPAFFLALDAWQSIAGDSRFALRFISIAAGMLAVALVYRIAADHFSRPAALCAALLFAVFEQPVYYGQSVRHYSWLLAGVALTLWLFLRVLRRPSWPRIAAYGASVAFVAYTLYIGLAAVAVQAVVGLFVWRAPARFKLRLLTAYIGAFLAFVPWLAFALPGVVRKVDAGVITGYHNSIASTPDGVLRMVDLLLGGQAALGLALVALAARPLSVSIRRFSVEARYPAHLTMLLSGVGLFLFMAVVNLRVGIVSERTLSFMAPAFALTLGVGLARLSPGLRNLLAGALVVWAVLTPQHAIPRLNSDLAAQAVAAGYSPGDLVLLETGFDDMAFAYEMANVLPAVGRRVFPSFSEYRFESDAAMQAALGAELAVTDRVWLVYWNVPPRMHVRLGEAGFQRVEQAKVPVGVDDPLYLSYPFIDVARYVRPDAAGDPLDFGGVLRLSDVIAPARVPAGGSFTVDLIWHALEAPDRDYTAALFLLDETGATRLEDFGPDAANPTSRWPLEGTTVDTRRLTLPADLPPGRYTLYAVAYWYQTVDSPLLVDGARGAAIAAIEIVAE